MCGWGLDGARFPPKAAEHAARAGADKRAENLRLAREADAQGLDAAANDLYRRLA